MEFVEMSKIGNIVDLYFKESSLPVTIKIGNKSLVKEVRYNREGSIVFTLYDGTVYTIDSNQIINEYQTLTQEVTYGE